MGNVQSGYNPGVEMLAEYSVGATVILIRFVARWKVVGITNLQIEDLFIAVALCCYTVVASLTWRISCIGSVFGQTAESVWLATPAEVAEWSQSQKYAFTIWWLYISYTWLLKASILTILGRLTARLGWQRIFVRAIMVYVSLCLVASFIAHGVICMPVRRTWQIQPYPGDQCIFRTRNYYLITIFNVTSDLAIVAAPLPVIFAARITIGRRLALMALLCSGILVAIAAVLRGYYSIKDISTVPVAAGWTARELCVAALVASAPGIKPLFSTSSWFAGSSHQNGNSGGSKSGQGAWNNELVTIGGTGAEPRHRLNNNDDDELAAPGFETGNKGQSQWHIRTKEADSRSDGSSEELILNDRTSGVNPQGAIHVTQKFQVTSNKL